MFFIRNALIFLLAGILTFGCAGQVQAKQRDRILVGVSLPTQRDERWVRDANKLKQVAKELGVELAVQISDNDASRQLSQCENLMAIGVDILILAPHDATSSSAIVKNAHRNGVKVISYDRLIMNADVDLYISFDNVQVGRLQGGYLTGLVPKGSYAVFGGAPTDNNAKLFKQGAMEIIKPLANKGDIKIVMDQWITDWQPTVAMNLMQNALTANNNKIDAVLAPNDNTAGGIIQALAGVGLAGKVPVSGQDAEVTAAKRIVKGQQSMTIFKDTRVLAAEAMNAAVKMVKGEDPGSTSKVNNNRIDVPSILLTPVVVDKENIDKVLIDSGYLNRSEVYD